MRKIYSGKSWVNNTALFNSTQQGYQQWTIPETGNYQITAYGAAGGKDAETQYKNGRGAWTQGNFDLTKGTQLLIIVGQAGGGMERTIRVVEEGQLGFLRYDAAHNLFDSESILCCEGHGPISGCQGKAV